MKLRRKLLSAGLAFGATALTLTTSTFAWYTSNNEVKVDAIKGATSATADSSSLYIAAATAYASTEEKVGPGALVSETTTYATTQKPVVLGSASKRVLTPVAFHGKNQYGTLTVTDGGYATTYSSVAPVAQDDFGNGIYYTKGEGESYTRATAWTESASDKYYKEVLTKNDDTVGYEDDITGACVYEYVLRFQKPNATAATPIYVSGFNLTNTATSTESAQQALAFDNPDGTKTGLKTGGQYNVDMLHALKMTVAVTNLTSDGSYPTSGEPAAPVNNYASVTVYDLDGFADTSKDTTNLGTTVNAVGYYNEVLGRKISTPTGYLATSNEFISSVACIASAAASVSNSTASEIFTIPDTGFVEVRFTFWLDGWDSFCYDVCQAQNFEVSMNFSTYASKSVLKTSDAATGKAASQGN